VPRDELPRGRLSGRFLHDVIEHLPLDTLAARPPCDEWQRLPEIRLLFERMARRHDRRPAHIPHAQRLIHTALTAPIHARDAAGAVTLPGGLAADALHPRREVEFLFPIPEPDHPLLAGDRNGDGDAPAWRIERGVVKGYIDLLFGHDGRFYVCDWKGDWLPDWQAATVTAHCRDNYTVQAQLYTLATLRLIGVGAGAGGDAAREDYERRFGGVLYCFLRGMRPDGDGTAGIFFQRPSFAEVAAWERAMLEPGYWGRA
jgi:exodeoxyribonuclease V beta subunit